MNHTTHDTCRIALNMELESDEGTVPEWIQLIPPGSELTGRDGRSWINDHPKGILDFFAAQRQDLPVDWEHSTELKAPQGEQAPAAGWINRMEVREGGSVWGRVVWTADGAESVSARNYRYLSPVIRYQMDNRRVLGITSVGLTNRPNLYVNAINHQTKEITMDLTQLLAVLGLPATATFQDAMNRIGQIKAEHATALNQASNPPLDKFVPRADYDTALNRATTAETKLADQAKAQLETAINAEIDAALKAGKITPGTKDYHVAQCRQEGGLERFKAYCQAAPVIAGASGLDGKDPGGSATALNAAETKICDMMGLSVEEYRKANNLK